MNEMTQSAPGMMGSGGGRVVIAVRESLSFTCILSVKPTSPGHRMLLWGGSAD